MKLRRTVSSECKNIWGEHKIIWENINGIIIYNIKYIYKYIIDIRVFLQIKIST